MKKVIVYTLCATLLLSGCGTYAGSGAFTGAHFGSILGSAIGGITDGRRGHNIGTIIGMAGGAAVGAVIGSAADDANRREVREHYNEVQRQKAQRQSSSYGNYGSNDDSGYYSPNNDGDDRLYDFQSSDYTSDYSASSPRIMDPSSSSIEDITSDYRVNKSIEVRNPRFVDDNHDGWLKSNETSKVIFEVYNASGETLYDIQPTVIESTKARNIYISPNIHVERLEPGKGIRYTAMVKAGKLRDGSATFCISVLQGNRVMSNVTEFTVITKK